MSLHFPNVASNLCIFNNENATSPLGDVAAKENTSNFKLNKIKNSKIENRLQY